MQPLKMTIPGQYWDSQIYSGRLYLFGISGNIITLDWDGIISNWKTKDSLKLALKCAFLRSNYLYGRDLDDLVKDREIKPIIENKFKELSKIELQITKSQIKKYILGEQDNKFPFPHSDSEIYHKTIYIGSRDGIHSANCDKTTKYPVSTKLTKQWDSPVFALSGSYGNLAIAAGDEGLYEISINPYSFPDEAIRNLSNDNCINCNWTFYSIYASSFNNPGFLVQYDKVRSLRNEFERNKYERIFNKILTEDNIFHESGYSWGVQDKLCLISDNKLHIVKYNPWQKDDNKIFVDHGIVRFERWKGNVISGKNAVFGIIIECDNAIIVIPSLGNNITIPGEPINWRVFPRSKHYENQLHIIYEDRLEIYSFNHDYLVDQESKVKGIQVFPSTR